MRIGLIGLSAKPFHAGHMTIIDRASRDNDSVIVFVSLSDRKRKGEPTILGTDMRKIWTSQLLDIMPANVQVIFGGSPIRKIYGALGDANEANSKDEYWVYGDPDDLAANFSEKALKKYADNLYGNGLLKLSAMPRSEGIDIKGSQMREFIRIGDKASFLKFMPRGVDGNAIWEILYTSLYGYSF